MCAFVFETQLEHCYLLVLVFTPSDTFRFDAIFQEIGRFLGFKWCYDSAPGKLARFSCGKLTAQCFLDETQEPITRQANEIFE